MAGEGSMAGAATSLRNNKALRKTDRSKWKNYLGANKKGTKKLGTISPSELQQLKLKLKKRNRTNLIINISFIVLFLMLFAIAIYYLDQSSY